MTGDEFENLALHSEAYVAAKSQSPQLADPNWKAAMQQDYDSLMMTSVTANVETADYLEEEPCADVLANSQTVKIEDSTCVRQMDIKTGYLIAPIDGEIFLEQPEGFKRDDGDMVCKLKRLLYGLKQSWRNWYECLAHRLEQLGLHSLQHDKCLWTQKRGDYHCWAMVLVDEIVHGSTSEDFGRWFQAEVGDFEYYNLTLGSPFAIFDPWIWHRHGTVPACSIYGCTAYSSLNDILNVQKRIVRFFSFSS